MKYYLSFLKLTSITVLTERLSEVVIHKLADVPRHVGEDDAVG